MSLALHATDSATPSTGLAPDLGRRWVQFFRWALVLLLVADIAGTPLHRHRHDSGIDGSAVHAQLAGSPHTAHDVEEHDHAPDFIHAVTTVRAESRAPAPDARAAAGPHDAAWAACTALPGRGTPAITGLAWNEHDTPLHRLHRSLPPAGRAPPLRA